MTARQSEFTAVHNRSIFEEPPAGCTSDGDLARWAEFRRRYHAAQSLEQVGPFPLQVDVELSSLCQMRCSFCVHGQQTVRKRNLPQRAFRKAMDEGADHGLCSVKFNYINEPLLVPDLVQSIAYARSRGVLNTYFATNGLLLDAHTSEALVGVRLSKVMVSLDATTAETFSLMRNSRKFDTILRNVETLLEVRTRAGAWWPRLRVNFVKTDINVHEHEAFVKRWTGVADSIGVQSQVARPGADDSVLASGPEDEPLGCSFPLKQLVVDSEGQILPCCTFSGRSMPLGNIAEITLADAWGSQKMRDLQALHMQRLGLANPICRACVGK